MEVRPADVVEIRFPDDADAERVQAPPVLVEPLGLQNDHVATVAVAIEKATRRRRRGDG